MNSHRIVSPMMVFIDGRMNSATMHPEDRPAQHPRPRRPKREVVRSDRGPCQRVADHRADDPDAQHDGEGDFLAIGAGDLLGQPGQGSGSACRTPA